MPFEKLVTAMQPERSLNHEPLVQVMLNWRAPRAETLALDGVCASILPVHTGTSKLDLTVFLLETENALRGEVEFSTAVFDAWRIEQLTAHLETLLEGVTAAPGARLSALPLLTAREQQRLLVEWNPPRDDTAGEDVLHALFEAQAVHQPDAVAVRMDADQLTYAELDARAGRLARRLHACGVGPDSLVGIFLERSLHMSVAILGTMKAGGAVMPLDTTFPAERLAVMVEDTRPAAVLTLATLRHRIPPMTCSILCLDDDEACGVEPGRRVLATHLACVLFTSGSSGRPKAVTMPHRALVNLMQWQVTRSGLPAGTRTMQFAAPGFDVSFQEMFATWAAGGTLVLAPDSARRDFAALLALMAEERIARVFLPTAALQPLSLAGLEAGAALPSLRQIDRRGRGAAHHARDAPVLRDAARMHPGEPVWPRRRRMWFLPSRSWTA